MLKFSKQLQWNSKFYETHGQPACYIMVPFIYTEKYNYGNHVLRFIH
jgi:hypothetical protein